jgi:hypothetical protein
VFKIAAKNSSDLAAVPPCISPPLSANAEHRGADLIFIHGRIETFQWPFEEE